MHRGDRAFAGQLQLQRSQLSGLRQRLEALNPLAVLQRGYAMVTTPDGEVVRSIGDVQAGDTINVHVSDGDFPAQVMDG